MKTPKIIDKIKDVDAFVESWTGALWGVAFHAEEAAHSFNKLKTAMFGCDKIDQCGKAKP